MLNPFFASHRNRPLFISLHMSILSAASYSVDMGFLYPYFDQETDSPPHWGSFAVLGTGAYQGGYVLLLLSSLPGDSRLSFLCFPIIRLIIFLLSIASNTLLPGRSPIQEGMICHHCESEHAVTR